MRKIIESITKVLLSSLALLCFVLLNSCQGVLPEEEMELAQLKNKSDMELSQLNNDGDDIGLSGLEDKESTDNLKAKLYGWWECTKLDLHDGREPITKQLSLIKVFLNDDGTGEIQSAPYISALVPNGKINWRLSGTRLTIIYQTGGEPTTLSIKWINDNQISVNYNLNGYTVDGEFARLTSIDTDK